jgi:hypothetical protein
VLGDRFLHEGIAIIRLGREVAAEHRLGIGIEDGEIELAVIGHDQGPVIGDELGEEAEHEQREEDPQRPEAPLVGTKIPQAAPRQRRDAHAEKADAGRRDGAGMDGVAHPARRSKSMRGSTST